MVAVTLRSIAALAVSLAVTGALGGNVQAPAIILPVDAAKNKQAVVDIFLDCWDAYKKYAYPHDDLTPVSLSYVDSYGGWGASVVDAMTTMVVMGQTELLEEAINFTSTIDYSTSPVSGTVSVFETTIRYLASMLSTYELTNEKYPALLAQSTLLADKLAFAWSEGNVVPYGELFYNQSEPEIMTSNIAEAGTLTLEWWTLAHYTGNDTYRQLAENSVRLIANLSDPLPGLPAQGIDPSSGEFVGAYVTWDGGSDSYFEYLIKYPRLTNTDDNTFADAWHAAVDSSIQNLAHTSTVGDWQYLSDWDDGTVIHTGSHLECFHAGNWMLGGKLLNNETIVNFGLKLMDACWNTYASTATGIGPESFAYFAADGNYTGVTPSSGDIAFYEKNGFFIQPGSEYYYMRPEVLESNFYAWRVTGDVKYQQRAAAALQSFQTWMPAPAGYAGIEDVDATDSAFIDDMQSFWFAEVLKYLYLTFDDPGQYSLDDYVFNTECHPFKAPAAKSVYGSGTPKKQPSTPFKSKSGPLPLVSPLPEKPDGALPTGS